jgi:hypothetical protein
MKGFYAIRAVIVCKDSIADTAQLIGIAIFHFVFNDKRDTSIYHVENICKGRNLLIGSKQ